MRPNAVLKLFQPQLELFLRDHTCFALRLFRSDLLTPGVESLPREFSGFDPSEAFFIFTPVHDKQMFAAFAFLPDSGGADFPAGAVPVDGPVTVLCGSPAPNDKISAAIFAYPDLHFPPNALFEVKPDEVPDGLRPQHFRKNIRSGEFKPGGQCFKAKRPVRAVLTRLPIIPRHFLRHRQVRAVNVQNGSEQLHDLSLYQGQFGGNGGELIRRYQLLDSREIMPQYTPQALPPLQ